MDVKEVLAAKREMEAEIQTAATKAASKFYDTTGLSLESIHVDLVKVHPVGKPSASVVVGVKSRLDM